MAETADVKCTCLKEGSRKCQFPHPCRNCYKYHPGVSCYWHAQGKRPTDKRTGGRTFDLSDGRKGCNECCNGDRCDDRTHYDRDSCPYCLGSNLPLERGEGKWLKRKLR